MDIAVVFFAGHGIEINGVNYVLPIDAKLKRDFDVEDEAVTLDRIIRAVEPAKKLRLIVLDACRENPFVRTVQHTAAIRSVVNGLGKVEPIISDTLIAYAAKAGSYSDDGDGTNSPFTMALLKHLMEPGLDIRLALGRVRDDVLKNTNSQQEPFVYGSLGGTSISLVPAPSAPKAPPPEEVRASYEMAERINTEAAWKAFLRTYRTGYHVDLARERLRLLQDSATAAKKKAEEESAAKALAEARAKARQEEERIAAEQRARQAAEARRQAEAAVAKKNAEEDAAAKAEAEARANARQEQERIAAERRDAEERARQEAEAKRQAAAEAAKKAEEEAKAKRQQEERVAAERREVEERARREAEAKRQAAAEAKAAKKSSIVVAALPPSAEAPVTATQADNTAAEQMKLVRALKTELKRVGCDPGKVDGMWGDKAKAALGEFARIAKVTLPSDAPDAKALELVLGQTGRICPEVPKIILKPTRRVANQPKVSEQAGKAGQSTSKQKCGYRGEWGGAKVGQKGWGNPTYSYSCD